MKNLLLTFLLYLLAIGLVVFGVMAIFGQISLKLDIPWIHYLNLPSISLVLGGILFNTIVAFPARIIPKAFLALTKINRSHSNQKAALIKEVDKVLAWSKEIKKDRTKALNRLTEQNTNNFDKFVLNLAATNYEQESLSKLSNQQIEAIYDNDMTHAAVFQSMGVASPSFGMMGTLLGLIIMMQSFENIAELGGGLAVALMTTLYGLLLSQFIFIPVSNKMKIAAQYQAERNSLVAQGLLLVLDKKPDLYIKDYLISSVAN